MSEDAMNDGLGFPPYYRETYILLFDVLYKEYVLDELIEWWINSDLCARFVIAAAASGSAVSAWGVWTTNGGETVWAIIASVACLLTIGYSIFPVSNRLREAAEGYVECVEIRERIEELLWLFRCEQSVDYEFMREELILLSRRFAVVTGKSIRFPFTRKKRLAHIQRRVEARLVDLGLTGEQHDLP